jgi:branched-subunit amino acid aminotransferase/4-amino-4-deoxychorismate lyase
MRSSPQTYLNLLHFQAQVVTSQPNYPVKKYAPIHGMPDTRSYVWYNGQFIRSNEPVIGLGNRAFAYGDGLFETIHAFGTQARHLDLHLNRLLHGMEILEMTVPSSLTQPFLQHEITRLLNKNRYFDSTRVRVTVFRDEGGYYTPSSGSVGITIEATPLPEKFYTYNTKGLVVDLYTDMRKPISPISGLKTCNALLYVMASMYKKRMHLDDCILINEQNRVVEATSSNLFLVVGNSIHTPPVDEGCVEGVMRRIVLEQAQKMGLMVEDTHYINPAMLMDADELFLTNAIRGIQWVVGLRQKRYLGIVSRQLSDRITRVSFPDQFREGFSG